MANYGASENCIEWLRGESKVTLSLSDPEMIRAVSELAQKDRAVTIIDRDRHTMCAVMPLEYIAVRKPRKRKDTDGAEDTASGHKAEEKAPRAERSVLPKSRVSPRKRKMPRG